MLSGLLSFFGGTAFRWLFGEILGFLRARDEHEQELAMLRLQHALDRERHEWQQQAIAAQAAAGVQVIRAQAEATAHAAADDMMLTAISQLGQSSGIKWVDAWNKSIRPALATVAIILLAGNAVAPSVIILQGVVLEVVCGILGLFIGGRINATGR